MELVLKRIAKKDDYTIGRLYVRKTVLDEYSAGEELEYVCDTLEPKWRDYAKGARKIKGKSAIPEGRYPCGDYLLKYVQEMVAVVGECPSFLRHSHPCRKHGKGHAGLHPRGLESEEGHGAQLAQVR